MLNGRGRVKEEAAERVEQIARELGYKPKHREPSFSGSGPRRRRIGEAQDLLLSTDRSIARIAEEVGFETQNYFKEPLNRSPRMSSRQKFPLI